MSEYRLLETKYLHKFDPCYSSIPLGNQV